MNDFEAQKIAAAVNLVRPDWPTNSLLTMIRKNLIDRPRRDVFVALAWVASEPNTATPARVLEAGPWWKAAAVDSTSSARRHPRPLEACRRCGREFGPACCDQPTQRPTQHHDRPSLRELVTAAHAATQTASDDHPTASEETPDE